MLDERVRLRLEQLNREPLPAAASPPMATAPAQPIQPALARQLVSDSMRPRCVKPISDLMGRGMATTNGSGEHWRIVLPLEELWPGGEELASKRCAHLERQLEESEATGMQQELRALVGAFPKNLLLMDLETCGLAGSSLFLIGLLRCLGGRLTVELLFARTYAEEQAVLASFWQVVHPESVLVTFNGKSFDWPMIADRTARHLLLRGRRLFQPVHVDLLHHARRRWRGKLPNCRLQTLERHVCGRGRIGDIPGNQIPAAYQHYVRTGMQQEMNAILLHNAIDLVTLLDIGLRLAG